MKNLLVTGGCGFIGSNFINKNFDLYQSVINIDVMHYVANELYIDEHIRMSDKYKLYKMDINDDIFDILTRHDIEVIVHFAAQSFVDLSFINPGLFITDNIVGTFKLLESCRKYGKCDRIIYISTDEVYGNSPDLHTEESPCKPTNPYAASKLAAEGLMKSYFYSYKMPIIILRPNNVFGKNQYPEKVIPKFMQQIQADEFITIHGSGDARRSFLYVDDLINAINTILTLGQLGEVYNIGCKSEYTIIELAKILLRILKNDVSTDKIQFIEDRVYNDMFYRISYDKIRALGWTPKISLVHGINLLAIN
jgi:dTDP-glucose 4,6-dehydratase